MPFYNSYTVSVLVIFNAYLVYSSPRIYGTEKQFKFYSRNDWGALPATDIEPIKLPVPYVVIHHTYIPGACNTTAQCMTDMRSMQRYHMSLDWGDIGYNFCVGSEGGAYEGRGWHTIGIHAGPANSFSIGICLIGDWRVEEPPAAMLQTTKDLIKTGVASGILSPDYKLMGHSQIMSTECPGSKLMEIISKWDNFVEGNGFVKPNI